MCNCNMIASCSEKAFGVSLNAFLHIIYLVKRKEYEKIKPLIVQTGKQEMSETEYYKDANGNDLLLVFYDKDGNVISE